MPEERLDAFVKDSFGLVGGTVIGDGGRGAQGVQCENLKWEVEYGVLCDALNAHR